MVFFGFKFIDLILNDMQIYSLFPTNSAYKSQYIYELAVNYGVIDD